MLAPRQRRAVPVGQQEGREVRVPERVTQDQVGIEQLGVGAGSGRERDDDVRGAPLRTDVALDVLLPAIQFGDDLVGRVAPPGAVASQLPRPAQLLGWRQEDPDVVGCAELLRAEVEQSLDHHEAVRAHVLRRPKPAAAVVVGGLQYRLPLTDVRQVLPENVEVVGGRVQRRDAELAPLLAPVAVVVVAADVGDVFAPAEDPDDAAGQGGLPGGGVPDNPEDDRTSHPRKDVRCRAGR